MKKIAVLYIATGRYTIFWDEFFKSSEQFFLSSENYSKEYFVFSDAKEIEHQDNDRVHLVYQEPLKWPYITLDRFSIFQKARKELEDFDYIYFFNGNMQFVDPITEEIIPSEDKPLIMVKHPGFHDKKREQFTYETSDNSLAGIPDHEGEHYFMGGLNGGVSKNYLQLIDDLEHRVETDKKNSIIALWHDESHLNRYGIDHADNIKVLDPSYGVPEGWNFPYEPKIIIRDKSNFGGHDFLRKKSKIKKFLKRIFKW